MRTLFLALVASVAAGASAQTVLTSATYGGHTYSLLSNSNWTAAEAVAISMGGHLATIDDAAEDGWVYSTFSSYGGVPRNLWIGLNDAAVEGSFVWASGSTASYRNFNPGEPNNNGNEDYVHIIQPGFGESGRWNDGGDYADGQAGYGDHFGVVEVVPEPASLAALGLGALVVLRRRSRS